MKTHSLLVAALVVLAILAGCGPKVKLLHQDESLTFAALRSGKIAIGGVVNLAGHDNDPQYEVERWPRMLESGLRTAREEIELVPGAIVAERLGEERSQLMLEDYRRHGDLDAGGLAELDSLLGGLARYAVLARMEDVTLRQSRNETDEDPDPKVERIKVTKSTTRTARASFDLYDLRERRSVWSGELTSNAENKVTFSNQKEEPKKGFWGFLTSVIAGGDPDYPEAPHVSDAVEAVCFDFARALPKKK